MKILNIKHILFLFLLVSSDLANTQELPPLWNLVSEPYDYAAVGGNTSISHLQSLILEQDPLTLASAATLLAIIDGSNQRDFILNQLRIPAPTSATEDWGRYFTYQEIRGYLGEEEAILGMDTVVSFLGLSRLGMQAILLLAEAGNFSYFELVEHAFYIDYRHFDAVTALGLYGQNETYRDQSRDLLVQAINGTNDHGRIAHAASSLAEFDKPTLVIVLRDRFASAQERFRLRLFNDLGLYDPEGQPERTMEAVASEADEFIRVSYFPSFASISEGVNTKRFIDPFFIKFTHDWLEQESSSLISVDVKKSFYDEFIPLPPPDTVTIEVMVGNLIGITSEASNYNWIGTFEGFVADLDVHLDAAQVAISAQDWEWAINELSSFRDRVDEAYRSPKPSRFATVDGYKFLYYNAQYIITRIEEQM